MAMADEDLMQAYQAGDTQAFEMLYLRSSPKLYAYLKKKLADPVQVEDVFQLVFLKLHKTRFQYDSKYLFEQWLFVIARSVMLDFIKQKRRQDLRFTDTDLDKIPDPLSQNGGRESYSTVEIPELSQLSKEQKEVVKLKVLDDLTYQEIAQKLKRSEVGVRQIFSRAVRKLRQLGTEGGNKI